MMTPMITVLIQVVACLTSLTVSCDPSSRIGSIACILLEAELTYRTTNVLEVAPPFCAFLHALAISYAER